MSQEFGAVFFSPLEGGPVRCRTLNPSSHPSWPDIRHPGCTNANMEAKDIMSRWDKYRLKRFEIWINQHFANHATPWKQAWINQGFPLIANSEENILKCKIELIRRLIKIKCRGCQNPEDWLLLFLFEDGALSIPQNIESLVAGNNCEVAPLDFLDPLKNPPDYNKLKNLYRTPQKLSMKYPLSGIQVSEVKTASSLRRSVKKSKKNLSKF